MKRAIIPALALLSAAACATDNGAEQTAAAGGEGASAELRDASGRSVGTATATQTTNGIRVRVEGVGLPPGAHGAHIHTTGACTPPGFESAGPHWNPTGHQHGKDNPAGMHKGDLPNVIIGADGSGTIEYTVDGATISGGANQLLDQDGSSIVVHATADDYRTDPSGNSGGRIACGVFR